VLIVALQLYSTTKLVTSVAVLQLVDRGLLDLDDGSLIETKLPELWAQDIVAFADENEDTQPTFTKRTKPITLRQLLTHTSGLSYMFNAPEIARWEKSIGRKDGIWAGTVEGFTQPLIFEPGTRWWYSIGIDWAGILVERVSGQRLEEYFREHIFEPLGIKHLTFIPTSDVQARLQQVCERGADGKLQHCEGMRSTSNPNLGQYSGGGGLFGTARDYLRFLRGILASGAGAQGAILSQKAFKELFTNSLPARDGSNTVHADIAAMAKRQTYHDPAHVNNDAQYLEHSVGLVLNTRDSVNGRRAGSGCWDGAAKTQYWLDPTTGVAVSSYSDWAD